jgi:hypothetical protein
MTEEKKKNSTGMTILLIVITIYSIYIELPLGFKINSELNLQ